MICWLDLETTGLEPKTGSILEIAMLMTTDELEPLDSFSMLVRPIHTRGLEVMDDYVRGMHAKSGLLREIFGADEPRGTPTINPMISGAGRVEAAAITWAQTVTAQKASVLVHGIDKTLRTVPLGGNSVHFDRAWIKEHMPDLEAVFSHRNIDCSTINELAKRWAPAVHASRPEGDKEPKHRAMDDVLHSIKLADYYRSRLFPTITIIPEAETMPFDAHGNIEASER